MFATWSAQGGSGGKGWGTVGSRTLHINMLLAKTVLCVGVSRGVVAEQPCHVLRLSPFRATAGIRTVPCMFLWW